MKLRAVMSVAVVGAHVTQELSESGIYDGGIVRARGVKPSVRLFMKFLRIQDSHIDRALEHLLHRFTHPALDGIEPPTRLRLY